MKISLLVNTEKIESAIQNLEKAAQFFQPFLDYVRTINPEITPEELRELVYNDAAHLQKWIGQKRASELPALASLPDTPQKWALATSPGELAAAAAVHQSTRTNRRIDRSFIYSLDFLPGDKLKPSQAALDALREEFTIYGNETQAEAFKDAQRLCNELNEFTIKYRSPLTTPLRGILQTQLNTPGYLRVDILELLRTIKNGTL